MLYPTIRDDAEIKAFLRKANENLGTLGYTDHGEGHCTLVAERAGGILKAFGYTEREIDLGKIAGCMHDIGNAINRSRHAEYGALLANELLKKFPLPVEDRVVAVSAIANHDESTGGAVDAVSAALIIADKTDVRRSRVRNKNRETFDIHDRVNFAVANTRLATDAQAKKITLSLDLDEEICSMFDYFDIFLSRMTMSRRAAERLGAQFSLLANGSRIL